MTKTVTEQIIDAKRSLSNGRNYDVLMQILDILAALNEEARRDKDSH